MVAVRGVLVATLVLALAACQSSGSPPAATTPSVASTTAGSATSRLTVATTTSTTVPAQTSGPRTVLSAIGLNVRADASKTATVLGTAAQGSTLTVLAHTDQGGGWYQVKGATVTGWISDNPKLSAPGKFKAYSSTPLQFSALYPDTWTVAEVPPASVAFHRPTGTDSIVASTAATVALLGRGRPGYRQSGAEQIVVCGVTGELVTFTQVTAALPTGAVPGGVAAGRYLAQVHLTLDAQHAIGIDGNLADLAQVQTVRDFANSITFPFPQCEGGAPTSTSVP